MSLRRLLFPAALLLCLSPTAVSGETVAEAWRSPFGEAWSVSAKASDGSCWAATGGSVMHVGADGTILSQTDGFLIARSVSVNQSDGSCWVADSYGHRVVHLAADGAVLWESDDFIQPVSVSVYAADGSCWVADWEGDAVIHLSAAHAEIWRGTDFLRPASVSVDSADGSCWVADEGSYEVVHLSSIGGEMARVGGFGVYGNPVSVSANSADGSCWVAMGEAGFVPPLVVHLASNGDELLRVTGFQDPVSVSVNPTDGSCWAADNRPPLSGGCVRHLNSAGNELWSGPFYYAESVCVRPTDGSCWVAERGTAEIVRLASNGDESLREGEFCQPADLSVSSSDHTCWVADFGHDEAVHLAADGTVLARYPGFTDCVAIAVNRTDGSWWVQRAVGESSSEVLHMSDAGLELWSGSYNATGIKVNPTDGSCYLLIRGSDLEEGRVIRLAADGAEMWQASGFSLPLGMAVNTSDGSCWVADTEHNHLVHLSATGTELSRDPSGISYAVAVDPYDGSCWYVRCELDPLTYWVVHVAENGAEIWRDDGTGHPYALAVDPTDGSCWVGDIGTYQVRHLAADGTELWRGGVFYGAESLSVDPADGSCWVIDRPNSQVAHLTTDRGPFAFTTSLSHFENSRSPWAAFAAGPGEADTWRQARTLPPLAHGGTYAMSSEVSDQAITGIRLALPVEPTGPMEVALRAWAYVGERSADDCSTFFGFRFDDTYPTASVGWSLDLGWEALSDTAGRLQLAGATQGTTVGLPAGGWHLVEVRYDRVASSLSLSLDGEEVATANAPGAAGAAPAYAVLGALGFDTGAQHQVYFDDVTVTLIGYKGTPQQNHGFALLQGRERVVNGQTVTYTIQYGNGYPMLKLDEQTDTEPETMYVAVGLPDGYSYYGADPSLDRLVDNVAVWELPMPAKGQMGYLYLHVVVPSAAPIGTTDRVWAWETSNAGAAASEPANPPNWLDPTDPTWGPPPDVLSQRIVAELQADVWVRKSGPRFVSPGGPVVYAITVGNSGDTQARDLVVRDIMPALLGGGDRIIGNIGVLDIGQTWAGIISSTLPWGVADGALLVNTAYVPSGPAEITIENNTSEWQTTTQAARDPNAISVAPTGGVERGRALTYTLECENVGAGTAYGVYATALLDPKLDGATLTVSDPDTVTYDPVNRAILWEVGTLASEEGASTSFTARVTSDAPRARPIIEQATVYFPSVPEETPTNVVANIVNGSFPDVAWDHWALLQIEVAYENGIVQGFDDGTYRPADVVDRGQMAVYVSRALAGGDAYVPTGPATPQFSDVDTDHWAYKYVEYAYAHDIVVGFQDGTYRPDDPVDRGQMAVYIARALAGGDAGVPTGPAVASFPDVTATSEWYYPHVEYIVAYGVTSGYEDGTYRPHYICTRDQMAVYVVRAFRLPT